MKHKNKYESIFTQKKRLPKNVYCIRQKRRAKLNLIKKWPKKPVSSREEEERRIKLLEEEANSSVFQRKWRYYASPYIII